MTCPFHFSGKLVKNGVESSLNYFKFVKYTADLCFSDFVFKIRLIRLCLSFPKQKILCLNSQPTDSQSGILPTTAQNQL